MGRVGTHWLFLFAFCSLGRHGGPLHQPNNTIPSLGVKSYLPKPMGHLLGSTFVGTSVHSKLCRLLFPRLVAPAKGH